MDEKTGRLFRLAATLDRLREAYAARILANAGRRQELVRRRLNIEALMEADTSLRGLTSAGGLRRLAEIAADLQALATEDDKLRRRLIDTFLKAKRARAAALAQLSVNARLEERRALASLADGLVHASQRQVKDL